MVLHTVRRAALAALLGCAAPWFGARAQIIRPPRNQAPQPNAWVSFGAGLLQLQDVHDGTTDSFWQFGTGAVAYRVSLEKPLQGGSTIGLAATFAQAPLTYVHAGVLGGTTSQDADANVSQIYAGFHAGGSSIGFHQVIEIGAGAQLYSNFRARDGGTKLPPNGVDADFAFSLGYGFGYGLSPDMQLDVVQDLGISVHQRTRLAANENTTPRSYTTRIGVRFALGR